MKKHGGKKKWIAAACVVLALFLFFWYENHHLVTTVYEYRSGTVGKELSGYRIVQISDLHNARFGKDNRKLLDQITSLNPDMIVITGDLVDSNHTNVERAVDFVRAAAEICPVYYVTGNHEYWLEDAERTELFAELEEAGAVILDNQRVSVSADGGKFDLIGLDDGNLSDGTLKELIGQCEEETLKVVLAHEPQYFSRYSETDADLVLSGHAHGGQFILPFVGAVVAPDQGLFPEYTSGRHERNGTTMYISRGLGNSVIPVRLFNDPEIVCVELRAEE